MSLGWIMCAVLFCNIALCLSLLVSLSELPYGSMRENLSLVVYEQQRHRPACASMQSDQRLCYSLIGKYHV